MRSPIRVVVFSPANLNAIDGSSIWTQTIALALAETPRVQAAVLLAHAITDTRIIGPLVDHPNVKVIDPFSGNAVSSSEALTLDEAARITSRRARRDLDFLIVRGLEAAERLARERALAGRLLPYLTDIPQHSADIDAGTVASIDTIMAAAPALLCQTEELRAHMAASFSSVANKGWVFPPIVPNGITPIVLPPPTASDLRLCYSGKFAFKWKTREMCELPRQLAERGVTAHLTMVGDKINQDHEAPDFVAEMRSRLVHSPGVEWVGGVSRKRSLELMSQAHVGLSWRSPALDDSLELSTKLLEYCAVGTPPMLNRTAMHERIFGEDYPLFIDRNTTVLDLLESAATQPELLEQAQQSIVGLPDEYTQTRASDRLSDLFDALYPDDSTSRRRGLLRKRGHRRQRH